MKKNIEVILVDDHQLFREGIRFLVDQMPNIHLMAECPNHKGLETVLRTQVPDIVLLDLDLPGEDGVEILKGMKVNYPEIKIIILTMYTDPKMMTYCMELGANGYLLKDSESGELQTAIETVYREGIYSNSLLAKAMLNSLKGKRVKRTGLHSGEVISHREKEVLRCIAQGLTAAEIAKKLFISQRTAEGHRKNLIAKLGVSNTATLIVKAIKENLIDIEH